MGPPNPYPSLCDVVLNCASLPPIPAFTPHVLSSSSNSPAQSDSSPVKMSPLLSFSRSASFRTLPLLPSDLPYTRVQVMHSTVWPNDRGKEVLSFVVLVDPGNNKESWKVEKLYSNVLGLDQQMRAVVSKSVVKKIRSLPEGKIWRDHAPAKADQRKVCHVCLLDFFSPCQLSCYHHRLPSSSISNCWLTSQSKTRMKSSPSSHPTLRETHKPVTRVGYKACSCMSSCTAWWAHLGSIHHLGSIL
jgi:hypothetical protein